MRRPIGRARARVLRHEISDRHLWRTGACTAALDHPRLCAQRRDPSAHAALRSLSPDLAPGPVRFRAFHLPARRRRLSLGVFAMKGSFTLVGRVAVTVIVVIAALAVGRALWVYYMESPWTRDGRVRADVVQVAPDVSGFVTEVPVKDNQKVRRGDVLFRIDRERFALALRQADAAVAGHQATLDQANSDLKRYSALTTDAVSQKKQERG